jgi:NitT/TauT family transport system permease protein
MLPYFFNAMKLGATLSVIGTVVAGYFGGQRAALGVWILNQVVLFKFPPAWAGILVACLIGIGFYVVIVALERITIPWHASMRAEG